MEQATIIGVKLGAIVSDQISKMCGRHRRTQFALYPEYPRASFVNKWEYINFSFSIRNVSNFALREISIEIGKSFAFFLNAEDELNSLRECAERVGISYAEDDDRYFFIPYLMPNAIHWLPSMQVKVPSRYENETICCYADIVFSYIDDNGAKRKCSIYPFFFNSWGPGYTPRRNANPIIKFDSFLRKKR